MKLVSLVWMIVLAVMLGITNIHADSLLVDRGLPTINLNNAAGGLRSNVAWVDGSYSASNYAVFGDSFQNTSAYVWNINSIQLWIVKSVETTQLWGGIGSNIEIISQNPTISNTSYGDGSTYQGSLGSYKDMYEVKFDVDITLAPSQIFKFFLDGTGGEYTIPFAHASNAALSGSNQQGSDDFLLSANIVNGAFDSSSVNTWTSDGNGWDKASDLNVKVYGTVPEPGSILLLSMGIGMLGLAGWRKK